MATQSVRKDVNGPEWPLGLIVVATPGTPVGIMSLVDPTSVNDPNASNAPGPNNAPKASEYSWGRCQQIEFQAFKAGASHGLQNNTGNIYIIRRGGTPGASNRDDYGSMVTVLTPGGAKTLGSAAQVVDVFSGYDYLIDADNAGDSCLVTLIIQ